jgi:hypothetical protein
MPSSTRSETTFLNVDLDVRAKHGLEELLDSIKGSVIVLHRTTEEASVELNRNCSTPEEAIQHFVALIGSLAPEARRIWDQSEVRKMNVGIQAGNEPHAVSFAVSGQNVLKLAGIGGELVITVYAPTDKG